MAKNKNNQSNKEPTDVDQSKVIEQLTAEIEAQNAKKAELDNQIAKAEEVLAGLDETIEAKQAQLGELEKALKNNPQPTPKPKAVTKPAQKIKTLKGAKTAHIKSRFDEGFRRAGIHFTKEAQEVDLTQLSEGQRQILEQEINLGASSSLIVEKVGE
ncbi:MAG: hypothetical protein HWE39_12815 [Oceanospirillaceae bacterium]|nr:hypothetical protein [Oceanospirillaceae bacterium]